MPRRDRSGLAIDRSPLYCIERIKQVSMARLLFTAYYADVSQSILVVLPSDIRRTGFVARYGSPHIAPDKTFLLTVPTLRYITSV